MSLLNVEFNEARLITKAYTDDSTDIEVVSMKVIEYQVCAKDFKRFLRWVRVVNPPVPGQTGDAIIPFVIYPHLLKTINTFASERLISILKARQIYLSTLTAAYILWYAMFHQGAKILVFSKGQPEAKQILSKCHSMYDQLPHFLRSPIYPDSVEGKALIELSWAGKPNSSVESG